MSNDPPQRKSLGKGIADGCLRPIGAFLATFGLGLGMTLVVVRLVLPPLPARTPPVEAYEAFGDAVDRLVPLTFGAALSLAAALIAAACVALRND